MVTATEQENNKTESRRHGALAAPQGQLEGHARGQLTNDAHKKTAPHREPGGRPSSDAQNPHAAGFHPPPFKPGDKRNYVASSPSQYGVL
jgi:hypothetical protein